MIDFLKTRQIITDVLFKPSNELSHFCGMVVLKKREVWSPYCDWDTEGQKKSLWFDSVDGNIRRLILYWIQNDQLRKEGIDETGEVIGYYSEMTQILSGGRKKFMDHYTLEDTGEFFRAMFVITLNDSIVIDSDGADKRW
jgi:hypothetical protein